jgi:hypothetical protein
MSVAIAGGGGADGVGAAIGAATGAGSTADVTACSTEEISPVLLADETDVLCVTGPSSPGLSTRTEMAILQPEHAARSGAAPEPDPQLQFQFHVHCDDEEGLIELVPVEPSEQFQFQFQTHVCGVTELGF